MHAGTIAAHDAGAVTIRLRSQSFERILGGHWAGEPRLSHDQDGSATASVSMRVWRLSTLIVVLVAAIGPARAQRTQLLERAVALTASTVSIEETDSVMFKARIRPDIAATLRTVAYAGDASDLEP